MGIPQADWIILLLLLDTILLLLLVFGVRRP